MRKSFLSKLRSRSDSGVGRPGCKTIRGCLWGSNQWPSPGVTYPGAIWQSLERFPVATAGRHYCHRWAEARDAVARCVGCGSAPTTKGSLIPNVSSARSENPAADGRREFLGLLHFRECLVKYDLTAHIIRRLDSLEPTCLLPATADEETLPGI